MKSCIAFVGLLFFAFGSNAHALDADASFTIGLGAAQQTDPSQYQDNTNYKYLLDSQADFAGQTYHIELRQQNEESSEKQDTGDSEIYIRPENSPVGYSISAEAGMIRYSKNMDWEF